MLNMSCAGFPKSKTQPHKLHPNGSLFIPSHTLYVQKVRDPGEFNAADEIASSYAGGSISLALSWAG